MNRYMKSLRTNFHQSDFMSAILALTAAVLNFLFLIIITRILTIQEYGEFAGTWAIISLAGIATTGLQNYSMAQASENFSKKHQDHEGKSFVLQAMAYSTLFSFIIFLILLVFFNSSLETLIRNSLLSFSIPIYVITSIVLGQTLGSGNPKRFYQIGVTLSIAKIVVSAIYLSFSKNLNCLIFLLLAFQAFFFGIIYKYYKMKNPNLGIISKEIKSFSIMSVTTLFYVLTIIDVPLFRLHSNSLEAGEYAGISTVTKIPLMILGIANTFIISKTSNILDLQSLKQFERSIRYKYFLTLGLIILIFLGLKDFIIHAFLGGKYENGNYFIGQILAYSGLYLLGYCISVFFKHISNRSLIKVFSLLLFQLTILFFLDISKQIFLGVICIFPILISLSLVPEKPLRKATKKI